MGFSREFSVLAHAPSHFDLYHRRLSAVKTVVLPVDEGCAGAAQWFACAERTADDLGEASSRAVTALTPSAII
jgi:hypothetical protein